MLGRARSMEAMLRRRAHHCDEHEVARDVCSKCGFARSVSVYEACFLREFNVQQLSYASMSSYRWHVGWSTAKWTTAAVCSYLTAESSDDFVCRRTVDGEGHRRQVRLYDDDYYHGRHHHHGVRAIAASCLCYFVARAVYSAQVVLFMY